MDIEAKISKFKAVKARRALWEPVWELIARYVLQQKQGFVSNVTPGEFYSNDQVDDNTAGKALHEMVSSIDGALWKNGARTFRFAPPEEARTTTEIQEFYRTVNRRILRQMEHENAAFGAARQEALKEGGAFGTDAIGVFSAPPGAGHLVEYKAMSLKNLYIVEDSRGRVAEEFYEYEYTAAQLVNEYGVAAQGNARVAALLEANDQDTKLKVLWYCCPRVNVDRLSEGVQKYSYESIHILIDEKVLLREAGFEGNPIIVSRFYKKEGWEYGFSPGYNALNPTIVLNSVIEMLEKGIELTALPSWYVLDDGTFGNGIIDRSPGGCIPIDVTSSRITGMAPIGQIGAVGDLKPTEWLANYLVDQIKGHFLIDKLTDLNNQTRMTLGEAQIRNELRSDNMGAVYSRQLDEKCTPIIRRTQAVLNERGYLGVARESVMYQKMVALGQEPLLIPPELVELQKQGVEIFRIEYVSPAARILRSEETRGVVSLCQFAYGFGEPEFVLRLNKRRIMPIIRDLYGAPEDALLSDKEFDQAMQDYLGAQQARAQLETGKVMAETEAKLGSAAQQKAQADATRSGMNGLTNGGGAGQPAFF